MTTAETTESSRARGRAALVNWGSTVAFSVVLPLLTYFLLTGVGWSAVAALLASGVWPAVESLVVLAVRRRIDEIGVIVLIFILLGVAAGVGFNTAPGWCW